MRLQDQQHEEPDINLTSLIDVVFLLLIFFMVSTTFDRQSLLRLDLPAAVTAETEAVPNVIEILITATGQVFIAEELLVTVSRTALQAALAAQLNERPDAPVVVRADGEASHRLVVMALDAAAAEGVARVGIAAIAEREGTP